MATPSQLAAQGQLLRVDADLDPDQMPKRALYALPRVAIWSDDVLPTLRSDGFHEGASTPAQQVDDYIVEFIAGDDLADRDLRPHPMKPESRDIWVLRTLDLRFFGWFWRKGIFIISAIETKERCLSINGLAAGYVNQAFRDRSTLQLDEPKFINGGIHDLL